ncbi:MAG: hypothetical protein ACLR4Z_07565 [Butyricicoccaceae bacterium]
MRPPELAESWDNVLGSAVRRPGDPEVTSVLCALDAAETVAQ